MAGNGDGTRFLGTGTTAAAMEADGAAGRDGGRSGGRDGRGGAPRKRERAAGPPALRVSPVGGVVHLRAAAEGVGGPPGGGPVPLSLFRMNLLACSADGTRFFVASNDALYVYRVLAGHAVDPVPEAYVPFDRDRWDAYRAEAAARAAAEALPEDAAETSASKEPDGVDMDGGGTSTTSGSSSESGSASDSESVGAPGQGAEGRRETAFINLVRCGGPRGSPLGASVAVCRTNDCVQVLVNAACRGAASSPEGPWGWDAWAVVDNNPPGPLRRAGTESQGTWSLGLSPVDGRMVMGSNAHRMSVADVGPGGGVAADDPRGPRSVDAVLRHGHNVPAMDISPCGRYVASASIDGHCRVVRMDGPPGDTSLVLEVEREIHSEWGWAIRWVPRDLGRNPSKGLEEYMLLYATQHDLFLLEATTLDVVGWMPDVLIDGMGSQHAVNGQVWFRVLEGLDRLALLEYVPDLSAVLVASHAADAVLVLRICHASSQREEDEDEDDLGERVDVEGDKGGEDEEGNARGTQGSVSSEVAHARESGEFEGPVEATRKPGSLPTSMQGIRRPLPFVFEKQACISNPLSDHHAPVVGLAVCQRVVPGATSAHGRARTGPRDAVLRGGCYASVLFLDATLGVWDISHAQSSLPRVLDIGDRLL